MSAPSPYILEGSPRPGRITSSAIARYLESRLAARDVRAVRKPLRAMYSSSHGDPTAEVLDAVSAGAPLVVISPIFLDTPPAQLLAWLARAADELPPEPRGSVAAVVHSGYLEHAHREHAIGTLERFAGEAGLRWHGAIDFGGSPLIDGQDLDSLGRMVRPLRRALDIFADDLAAGRAISPRARRTAARQGFPLPDFLLPAMMNFVVRRRIRDEGVVDPFARPFSD